MKGRIVEALKFVRHMTGIFLVLWAAYHLFRWVDEVSRVW